MSTNKGLVEFNPHTETFRSYDVADGAQSEFEEQAYYKSTAGEMFFGGFNGLTAFYPERITNNENIPPIVITNFLLFNKPVSIGADSHLQKAIWATDHITLSDQDYSFAFEFAALSYVAPEKNRHKYKLEGFDEEWNDVDSKRRYAAYTNLPAGDYTFRVIGSNNHRLWNEEGAAITITVAQPWWATLKTEKEAAELASRAAEASNHAKSTFLANMSHELRTPLNGILGYAQILKRHRNLNPTVKTGLNIIHQSGNHLLMLINDILDLSKIEARKMELYPTEINLASFLDGVVGIMRMRAQQKALRFIHELAVDLPPGIEADEKRLRQVLLNLLGNAVKFTKSGGTVTFVVRHAAKRSAVKESEQRHSGDSVPHYEHVRFEIQDTGVGMTPEQLEKIFDPFEQVGEMQQRIEGTGLGLAISCQLVELMGGEIQVRSEFGQGATFWFEVVFQVIAVTPQTPRPRRGEIVGYTGARQNVLVVDDNQENRMMLFNLLEPLGFGVTLAEHGQEGVAKAQEIHPDVILMDLAMPVMNGFEAVKILRQLPAFKDIPILVVSASALTMDHTQSQQIGCDGFVAKPVDADQLLTCLERRLHVTWMYENLPVEPEDTAQPGSEADLIPPPPEEIEAFYELAMFGDMDLIRERVRYLEELDPKYSPFAKRLHELATALEDEQIVTLLEQYMEQTI